MLELNLTVVDVAPAKHAAAPTLYFKLAISQKVGQGEQPVPIQSISLQCQIRIEAKRRIYKRDEQTRMSDLFGAPARWSQTLHSMLWTHASVVAPAFESDRTVVDLPVPCSFDFNLAATKYFYGLEYGEVPLLLLFSGSVFYRDAEGRLEMDLISWNKEAKYNLPVKIWQDMMEIYYPNCTWLCIDRQAFQALYEYKRRHGYTGFDEALISLLPDTNTVAL